MILSLSTGVVALVATFTVSDHTVGEFFAAGAALFALGNTILIARNGRKARREHEAAHAEREHIATRVAQVEEKVVDANGSSRPPSSRTRSTDNDPPQG